MGSKRLNQTLRQHAKTQRFGPDGYCQDCGETDKRALQMTTVSNRDAVLCAECRLARQGKSTTEHHHPAGQHNDTFASPLPANAHAIFTDLQNDWDKETLMNPNHDLLRTLAAWLHFFADAFKYLSTQARTWAEQLETYSSYLTEQLGPQWWTAIEYEVTP